MSVSPIVIGLAAAVLAGFSRGFAAFGTALVYVPLMSAAFDVRTAVVTLFLVDLLPSAPYIYRASKETDYNTVFWMGASAVVFTPVGVLVLRLAPQRMLMLIVSCFLIAVTLFNLLASGLIHVPREPSQQRGGGRPVWTDRRRCWPLRAARDDLLTRDL